MPNEGASSVRICGVVNMRPLNLRGRFRCGSEEEVAEEGRQLSEERRSHIAQK